MTPMNKTRISIAIIVVAHLIVNVLHGQAHTSLGVGLSSWQQLFVIVVILLAPLVALVLSLTRYVRTGLWLLLISMLGAFVFGAFYHYVIISPDHVAHLPIGDARGLFRVTAVLLLITEAIGVALAGLSLKLRVSR
jgi:predicted membrane protein